MIPLISTSGTSRTQRVSRTCWTWRKKCKILLCAWYFVLLSSNFKSFYSRNWWV